MGKPNIVAGTAGGLVGGILLALSLQVAGRIHTAGRIVGAEGAAAGWATLVVVGLLLGILYAFVLGRISHTWVTGLGVGAAYGVVWWVLGTLIILPLAIGQAMFAITASTAANFVGYLLLGIAIGVVYTAMTAGADEGPRTGTPESPTSDPTQMPGV